MKLLDYTGLGHLVEKLGWLADKTVFFESLSRAYWNSYTWNISGTEVVFNINSLFIDGINVNNSEIIFELFDSTMPGRVMDTMRIPSYEAMGSASYITVLKSGWCPQPGSGDSQSATVSVMIQGGQVRASGNMMGGYQPQIRMYARKFIR